MRGTYLLLILVILSQLVHSSLTKPSKSSPFQILAAFISESGAESCEEPVSALVDHLNALSRSQSTLKHIDGTSYEFYQRSHSKNINEGVTGRAERTADRVGACADALFACELIDQTFEEVPPVLHEKIVLFNTTISNPIPMTIVVLYERDYDGEAGVDHGGINGLTLESLHNQKKTQNGIIPRGRFLILLKDFTECDMSNSLRLLDHAPTSFELSLGLVTGEIASVNSILWKAAANILDLLEANSVFEVCQMNKTATSKIEESEVQKDSSLIDPAIHVVGRSLAGGVATLAALMLDGTIPYPKSTRKHKRGRKGKKRIKGYEDKSSGGTTASQTLGNLHGYGKSRTSCVVLGAPPSISANIKAPYITSIINGDDIICRSTKDSLDRLRQRLKRIQGSNILTKQVGWMTDTVALTFSNIKSHAHGSEGEECKLSIPGNAYLVRPRRMNGVSSLHQITDRGGREALRGALLWQLNDILLSNSMWKHHSLESYISGLNKVQFRKLSESGS